MYSIVLTRQIDTTPCKGQTGKHLMSCKTLYVWVQYQWRQILALTSTWVKLLRSSSSESRTTNSSLHHLTLCDPGHISVIQHVLFLLWLPRDVKHKKVVVASLLILRLLHQCLPFLKSNIRELNANSIDKVAFQKVWINPLWILIALRGCILCFHPVRGRCKAAY